MAWVSNNNLGAYVWYAGPLLPDVPFLINAPDSGLFPADAGEIDYVTVSAGIQSEDINWSDVDADAYTYRTGTSFYSHDETTDSVAPLNVFVLYYNLTYDDPDGSWTPSVSGDSLLPAGLAGGGSEPPPPPPPPNDDFANRLPISGRCGQLLVGDRGATREFSWENSYPGQGRTTWYEWTAPFTGWVLFRTAWNEVVCNLWQGPLIEGHPQWLASFQYYAAELMTWAAVIAGQTYYVQVDLFSPGGSPGVLRWQKLEDEPERTIYGHSYFRAIDPHSTPDTDSQGYARVFNVGEYSEAPNPMTALDDGLYVNLDGVSEADKHEYGGMGMMHPVLTYLDTNQNPPFSGDDMPEGATITDIGWGAIAFVPSKNSYANLTGAVIRPDGSFEKSASVRLLSPNYINHDRIYTGAGVYGPNLPTPEEILAGQVQIAIGISWPIRDWTGALNPDASGGSETQLDFVYLSVSWNKSVGLPVPPWSCIAPPMRQRHRDDGLTTDAKQQRGQGSSRQSSIRQGGRVYY